MTNQYTVNCNLFYCKIALKGVCFFTNKLVNKYRNDMAFLLHMCSKKRYLYPVSKKREKYSEKKFEYFCLTYRFEPT